MSEYERQDALQPDLLPDERSPEEIEREIERTRERMSSNIDALGDKLSPDNLKQQAKEAITGKAQDVVSNVGEQARRTGCRMMDFIPENPLPGRGRGTGRHLALPSQREPERDVGRPHGAVRLHRARAPWHRIKGGSRTGPRRCATRSGAEGSASAAETVSGERADELGSGARDRARELGHRAQEQTRRARGGLERLMEENPLAVAAGVAVIGLAAGLLVPETRAGAPYPRAGPGRPGRAGPDAPRAGSRTPPSRRDRK